MTFVRAIAVAIMAATVTLSGGARGQRIPTSQRRGLYDASLSKPLLQAAERGDFAEVAHLLARGDDPRVRGALGWTPMMFAGVRGDPDIVDRLLKAGAPIDETDDTGDTPLMNACVPGRVGAVKMLLKRGAAVNHANHANETALTFAAEFGWPDVVSVLLAHHAKVNIHNRNGQPILTLVCGHPAPKDALGRRHHLRQLRVVKMLLDAGADVNASSKDGYTALMSASGWGDVDAVKLLLARHPHLNVRDKRGKTALGYAVSQHRTEVVDILTQAGAKR